MSLSQKIARVPRPFDIQKAADLGAHIGWASPEIKELVVGAGACSPYLAGLIGKQGDWLERAIEDVEGALSAELDAVLNLGASELMDGLRQAKQRIALVTALADLGGAWPLEKVTGTLTQLADAACQSAIRIAVAQQVRRGKLPGMTEDNLEDAGGLCIFAMGKMGARELNYSSDIDLICLFDETRFDPDDFFDARQAFVRATRATCASLSDITAQGYVFRTDLRLRPDPSVTPVCIAMEAAEHYYESLGRTWERAAYIKARPAAGDVEAGKRFLDALRPFVWRRHLDFAAIQDAHDMRLAIREHKGLGGPITLPGHNMKLGRGGIREIEFFTQTRQLIAGGRDPDLRCRGTVAGLQVLSEKGWVPPDVTRELQSHYVFHRTVEHRLQMVQDAQTHNLPAGAEGFDRLAAMMDRETDELKEELRDRLEAVHKMTEGFFAPDAPVPVPDKTLLDEKILQRWMSYPALRSTRSREVFERVRPELSARLAQATRPQEALVAFDGFLAGLPAGVQLFSLLEANPQLTDLLIDITGISASLAQYLSRNASVFDAVIGGDFFSDWPGEDGLVPLLEAVLARETDYETKLDQTRRWSKEWHFRIGVHLLRGLIEPADASAQYADLASAVLRVLWPEVIAQFGLKYGPPPGRGAVILGLGSLGAGTLNAASDLDLIVIYDPEDQDSSTGKKSLPSRLYYARLTQALITALSAPMAQGKLYEVDMRLRPSGNQGPVATSWQAFQSYQREEAWVWEHLALTRARVVAGPTSLAEDVETFRQDLLAQSRGTSDVLREVAEMRRRIQAAKAAESPLDVKIGAGRLQELELLGQAGALLKGLPGVTAADGIMALEGLGILSASDAGHLAREAAFYADVHTVVRLLSDKPLDVTDLGPAGREFLRRSLDQKTPEALERRLVESYQKNEELLSKLLAPYHGDEETL